MTRWIRILIYIAAGVALLVSLFFLFEWAGDLLDSGGALSRAGASED